MAKKQMSVEEMKKAIFEKNQADLMKPSEVLGKHENKYLHLTEADRAKVENIKNGLRGGVGFSQIGLTNPEYAGRVWGVGKSGVVTKLLNKEKRGLPNDAKSIWSTFIGSPDMHTSNQLVFNRMWNKFQEAKKAGKLTPELEQKMIGIMKAAMTAEKAGESAKPIFDENVNLDDTHHLFDTFERRRILSDLMAGKKIGGKKGQIFDANKVIEESTDPRLLHAPTFSVGPHLFEFNRESSHEPHLNKAFPFMLHGTAHPEVFKQVPMDMVAPDFFNEIRQSKGREPGYMDFVRGIPRQHINEKMLTALQKAGYAQGGGVEPSIDQMNAALTMRRMADGGSVKKNKKNVIAKHQKGEKVGGYHVGDKIKNFSSYDASDIKNVLNGVYKVPMSSFETTHPHDLFYAKNDIDHVKHLAEQIKNNGYLDPLLVAIDEKGPYVLEGGHGLGAAHLLGMKEIPAMIGYEDGLEDKHILHKADGGAVDITNVGANEAPDLETKVSIPMGGEMNMGGVDLDPVQQGTQFMPTPQPQQGVPNQNAPQQVDQFGQPQMPQQPNMLGGGAPQISTPPMSPQPPSNILQMTRQGQAMAAMKPQGAGLPQMKDGGTVKEKALAKFLAESKIKQRLYHGTTADIKHFDPSKHGQKDHGWYGHGHYFTADPETASAYANYDEYKDKSPTTGANVIPVHVHVKNPYYWPEDRKPAQTKEESEKITKELMNAGHDSVVVSNKYQHPDYMQHHEVVVFDPHRIKSAIGNRGTYDMTKKDLTMNKGGEVKGTMPSLDSMRYALTTKKAK